MISKFRNTIAFSILCCLLIASCKEKSSNPNDNAFQFILGTVVYPAKDSPMPAKGVKFIDPDFGTSIYRITDKNTDGYSDPGIQNEYAKADPENCDGTMIILRGNNANYMLYNAVTFAVIRELTVFNQCNEEPEPRWDSQNPDIFYFVSNAQLVQYNVKTSQQILIHDFTVQYPTAAYVHTDVEGDASLDRRYWCFMVEDENYTVQAVIVYDKTLDAIVGEKTTGFPGDIIWVGMSMKGDYCIIGYDIQSFPEVYSRDFSTSFNFPSGSDGHCEFALSADGKDVLVYQNVLTDFITVFDLTTSTEIQLVQVPFNVNYDIGLHVSGNCSQTPGWVLVSTYGSYNPPTGIDHSWMDCQLFMVELKSNPRIWRLCHTQAYTSQEFEGDKNYFAECFAAINTKGTNIYFGSNWRDYSEYYTEAYVLRLPANWVSNMP